MILLHQLWNQRRQNLWIFIELLVAGFFLWMVVDPIYVLTADRLIPPGIDSKGAYVLQLGQYDPSFGNYDATQDSDALMRAHYLDIVRRVRQCPEVESVAISAFGSFPNSQSWNGTGLYAPDTTYLHLQSYRFVPLEGSDLPRTYGLTDVHTGRVLSLPADFTQRGKVALSEGAARRLFGTADVVGRTVYDDKELTEPHEVAAVFRDVKHYSSEQPYPLVLTGEADLFTSTYMSYMYHLVLRLKDGVDADAFEERFRTEVAPTLQSGNFFFDSLLTFSEYSRRQALSSGVTNKLRLQYALGGFALLCIFLGMAGTFWIRSEARREEIGIRRSMGASTRRITLQFLGEAGVLVTVAYALALLVVVNYVNFAGLSGGAELGNFRDDLVPNPAYAQNQPVPHFLWVTGLTYIVLLLTALAGTYLPVRRAARTLPVEALREE